MPADAGAGSTSGVAALFCFVDAGPGRSVIAANEQHVFLAVSVVALAFEGDWYLARGTKAIVPPALRIGL